MPRRPERWAAPKPRFRGVCSPHVGSSSGSCRNKREPKTRMTNRELDEVLKSAPVPEREAEYWEEFPKRVIRGLGAAPREDARRSAASVQGPAGSRWTLWPKVAFATGLAAVCLVIGLLIGLH